MLSHATILAPFSGRVVKKLIDVGDMVAPGRPMFVIDTFQRPELHAFLTESLIPYLKPGKEIETHVDALNKTVMGTIREIAPQSDPNTRTVLVKVSLNLTPRWSMVSSPDSEWSTANTTPSSSPSNWFARWASCTLWKWPTERGIPGAAS